MYLKIPREPELPTYAGSANNPGPRISRSPLEIEISDGFPIFDRIMHMNEKYELDNIDLYAVVLCTGDYFSLRELAMDRMMYHNHEDNGDFLINDIQIFLDPFMGRGRIQPLFKERDAIKIMGKL